MIRATYAGISDDADLVVIPAVVIPTPTLTVSPSSQTIEVGQTAVYDAVFDADGAGTASSPVDVTASAVWSSSNPNVAYRSGNGVFIGTNEGSVTVTATYQGLSGTAALIVIPGPVLPPTPTLSVNPPGQTIQVGDAASYSATYDADGSGTAYSPIVVTIPSFWSSNDPATAQVTGFGTFTGMDVGTTTITATYLGLTDSAQLVVTAGQVVPTPTLTVTPVQQSVDVGDSVGYTAEYDADGTGPGAAIDVTATASWASLDPTVGRSDGGGDFTGMRAGSVPINATYLGLTRSAMLTVVGAPPSCSPTSQTVEENEEAVLTASGGTGSYTWSAPAGNPSVASGNTLRVRYASDGVRSVTVASGGETSAPCTVRVEDAASTSPTLDVNPDSQSVAIGGTVSYTATYDPDGSGPQSSENVTTAATWSSDTPAAAQSQGNGIFRGVAQGSAGVRATYQGLTDTAGINVTGNQISCTFGASPATLFIPPSRATTLTWQCNRPAACIVSNVTDGGGQVASSNTGSGSGQSSPRYTTRYRLNCDNGAVSLDTVVRVFDVTTRIEILPQ